MNDISSSVSKFLEISFEVPSDMCDLDEDEIECIPNVGLKKADAIKKGLIIDESTTLCVKQL